MRLIYTHFHTVIKSIQKGFLGRIAFVAFILLLLAQHSFAQTTLGGVNLGNLPQYLFVFTDARDDANWQSASKGYVGNVAIDGIQAKERTSGSFAYAGTIYTNAANLDAWQNIVSNNSGQANGVFNETTRINNLTTDLESAFSQINALPVTPGYNGIAATALNGLNTQNGIPQVIVINVTSGFSISSKINITGDATDIFFLRWDTDANFSDGYEGEVKFQSGGAIVPLGGLKPTNFIHVAGELNSSGGGSNPAAPYPQGPRLNNGTGALISGASDFSGGGFFTGYWLTTGKPDNTGSGQPYGDNPSLSNGIFVGGWYSKNTKFSMTSGTSGVYVSPPTTSNCVIPNAGPDQVLGCTNNQLPTSFDLVDAQAGQKWKIVSLPAGSSISVTTPSGAVTGTITAGTYTFRLQNQSDSINCFDQVNVVVQPCGGGNFTEQICYLSPTKPNQVSAKQEWRINPDQTVTIRTTFAKTFVDNTYGTNAIGWPSGHTFGNLDGSDKLTLSLRDANGLQKMNLTLDYIDGDNSVPSGYRTLGVSGGEGKVNAGSAADVVNVKTSLSENLNTFGYVLTTNSPATDANYTPNPTYPNWIYDVWYEVTVKLSAFGAAGFGTPFIEEVHASPSKTGNNTEAVEPGACPVTCANPPSGGPDQILPCYGQPPTSIDLADAQAGQKWKIMSPVPAGASISIATPSGLVTGTFVAGTYTFRLQDQSDSLNCYDLVNVTIQPCFTNEICYISPTKPNQVSAKQEWTVNQAAGTATIRTTFAKTFVDNTYGTNAIGWPGGHSFGNLDGSDKLTLSLRDGNGVQKMNLTLDYIDGDNSVPSGYKTGGVTDGEGKVNAGSAADVVNVKTSLSENLNTFGYVLTTNSPATDANYTPNPTYPNWIYDVWYEVTVKLSAFGAAGFGSPLIEEVHASPSKTGNNTEEVTPGACPTASAQGGAVCEGNSITLQSTTAPAGATIQWTGPNGFTSTQANPVINNATSANAGVYTLKVTFNNLSKSDTAIVTVFPKPNKPTASFTGPACLGNTLNLFGSAESGVTYSWKGPNNFTSSVQNPTINNLTAAASGQYILTVSKNGCTAADTVVVNVVNCCPVITTNDSRDTLCSGYYGEFFIANYNDLGGNGIKFVMFTSPQTGSSVYTGGTVVTPSSFSNGVAQWPTGQPGSQFPANNGTTPVNYYVYAILSTTPTDPNCRPFAEKIFTILPLPNFTATPQSACTYDQSYVLNVNITTAGTYTVTFARNLTTVGNGPVPVNQFFTQGNVSGSTTTPFNVPIAEANGFFVFVTNQATGCTVVGPSGSPTINPKPNAGADKSLACADPVQGTLQTTTTLTGFSPAGGTWSVQAGSPANASVNNSGSVTGMTVAGTYKFIYNVNGCTDTVAVSVQPCQGCIKPDAGQDVVICEPQTAYNLSGFTPSGGTWAAQSGNPANASINVAGQITGMTANGTYRFIYTIQFGGGLCSDTVAVIRQPKPNAGQDVSICEPLTSTILTGFSPVGGTWTAALNNPSSASINNSGQVTGLIANGTYRFIYSANGCADTVQVVRNPKPNAGPNQSICAPQTTASLSGFSPAGGTWSIVAGNPASASVTNAGAVSGMTVNGTYQFMYTVNGCTDTVAITRVSKPNAGQDQTICEPQTIATLTGFSPAGGTWTIAAGNPAAATVTNAGAVSGLTINGTYQFIYTVNGCADTVAVIRNAKPYAGPDQTICAPQTTVSLTGFPSAGGIWTAQPGNPANATITSAGVVTGMSSNGTYRFIYSVNGCTDTVAVIRTAKPFAGLDQNICEPQTIALLTGFAPSGGTWIAALGNPASATVSNDGIVTGLTANGTYKFVYLFNDCSDTVQVVRNIAPNAGQDQTICAPQSSTTLTGFPSGGTWTVGGGNPANASITNAGVVTGMSANGTYNFIYTVNGCSDIVVVVRSDKPNAGPDQTLACADPVQGTLQTSTTLTGFSPAGGTWTAQAGNPAGATVTNAGAVTGMTVAGTYRFIYTLNGCADTVAVTVQPCQGCVKPNAGPDVAICAPQTGVTLTGFSPAGGIWTARAGNPAAATVTSAGVVSGMTVNGTYGFVYTVQQGGQFCSDTVQVVRNAKPNAGPDQTICAPQTTVSLTGSPAGGSWTAQAGNPASATVNANGAVSGLTANGTYNFIYTVNGCADTVAVVRNAKPNAGVDQTLACADPVQGTLQTTTTLTGFSPAGGTWSAQAGNPASATVTNAGAVSGMTVAGSYKFIYSLNGCADTVMVTVQSCVGCTKPNAGNDQSICEPVTATTLTGFSPAGGTWSAQAGNPASATVTNAGAVSGMTSNGTYRFIYSVVQGGQTCSDTVAVVRNAKPNAGPDKSLACADPVQGTLQTTTTLTGFSPAGGTWSAQAGNPANATVTSAGAVNGMTVVGTYKFIYTLNGCADTVAVTVQPCQGCVKPNAGSDQSICEPVTTASLTGFTPAGGTWSAQAGNPATATVTNAGVVSGMTANGTYRFIYSVLQGGQTCSDTVAVVRNAKPNAGPDKSLACADPVQGTLQTTTTLTGFSPAGGTWAAQAGNPAAATVTNAGAVAGMTVAGTYNFIYSLNGCADTVMVTVQSCQGCTKPNAGPDQSICAPLTTTTLTGFAPAGGTWAAQAGNPAAATVTNAGVVTGMTANGTYRFVYSLVQGGQTCTDTVAVVRNAKPNAGPDQTICSPQTTTTLTGFSPAGGTWSAAAGNPATATVTNAGVVAGMTANGTYNFIYTLNACADTVAVVRNAKPNAGPDQTLACADPVQGTLQTTTTLTGFSPAGGTWAAQAGNPAAATVTNAGAVAGMTVAGTYNFIYSLNGCADTVMVTVQSCQGCTKPNAGPDQSICAPLATTTLTGFAPAGGTWAAQAGNPAAATVTNAGVVTGMTANGTYRFVYSVVQGGQTCSDTVAVVRNAKPNAGPDQTICAPITTTTLTGFSPAGGTWSAAAGNPAGATVTNAGAVAGMTANGTYNFVYTLNGCADTVAVVRNVKPNAGPDQTLACADPVQGTLQTTTTLTGFSPAGGTWSAQAGNPANATVTSAGAVNGMTVVGTYKFIYTLNGCADTVAVTVQPCQGCVKPNAGSDQSICEPVTTASLTGFTPAGGTWSAQAGNPATATVTNAGVVSGMTANGTYRFIYSVVQGGQTCSDTVAVIRKPKPVVGDAVICAPATTATLTLAPTGGAWTAQAGNPASAIVSPSGAVSGLSADGTYKFIYTVNGCSDTSTVVRNTKPSAGADKSLACADPVQGTLQTTTTLTGFSPAGGTWSAQAGNPAGATVTNAGAVSGMTVAGSYKFIYSLNGCADTVMVTVQSCVGCTKPDAGNDQSICEPTTTTTLTGFSPAGGTWAAQAGNPAAATVTANGAVSGMSANGTYRFIYSVLQGGQTCTDTVQVTRNAKPNAGPDQAICEPISTTTLTGFSPAGGTWAAQSANPASATVTANGTVSGMSANGTYRFIYTLNGCADTVAVTRNAKPNAGPDQAICEPISTTTLSGFSPAGGTWSAQSGNPASATVTNAGVVSGMSANGTYRFIYTLNGCADTVQVVRNIKPNAGADKSLACADPVQGTLQTTTTLTGFSPAGGTWSAQSGNPAGATVTNAGAVSGMTVAGSYKFIYSLNGCADTVMVTVQSCVGCTKPDAGNDQSICEPTTTTTLTGFSPAGGTWAAQAGNPAGATVTNAGVVSGMTSNGTYRFIYSVVQGGQTCSDTVAVTRNAKPNAGPDQTICEPISTTTLSGFSPAGGTWAAQSANPASATVTANGTVSGMSANGTYRFIYTLNGCADTVAVTRNAKPNAGPDQAICEPITTTTLSGFSPAGGTWAAQAGNPAGATVTNAGVVSGMSANGTYRFIYTLNGCADTVAVTRNAKPNAGPDQAICEPISTTTLSGFSPAGGTWSAQSGNPASATVTNAGVVSGMSANGTYRFIYTLNGCADTVQVVRNIKPNAGADKSLACADPVQGTLQTTTTLTGFSPAGGTWSAQSGNPASATVTNAGAVTGMTSSGTYRFIYSLNGCADTVSVTVQTCVGCTKPDAGNDQSICEPTTTTTLTGFSPAGGTWAAQAGNPAGATVTNAGVVTGMTANGTYRFIYSVVQGGQTCSDTVAVVRNPKPVVGDAQICEPATTASVTLNLSGGTWTADGANPASATISPNGQVSGLSANGTYRFIYTLNGCSDTSTVVRNAKPKAGPDIIGNDAVCNTIGTINLPDASTGESWTQLGTSPKQVTINATSGVVTGMDVIGTYQFILANSATGCSDTVKVEVKDCNKGSIGDFVWKDLNDNGIQDAGEPGVSGVVVQLLNGITNAIITSDTTDANGIYGFSNLSSGSYKVKIVVSSLPDTCLISPKKDVTTGGGNDTNDSDFDPTTAESPVIVINTSGTGIQKDNPTIDAGLYSPKGTIGDFVWKDLNDNGQQDAGEPGVNGVKVILWRAVGGVPSSKLDSTVTAGNGAYLFSGLKKDNYIVQIVLNTLPDSCLISLKPNVGSDLTDSDFTPAGLSPVVSLDPALGGINKDNTTIDAGLYSPKGTIGDFVWKDLNDNGQQDAGEPGVNGVKVILWQAVGGVPTTKLDSTLTAGNGAYIFTNLKKNTYIVQLVLSTLPDSCQISLKKDVGNDATDNDFTPAGLSPVVSIDPAGNGLTRNNPTIDAGLYSPKGTIGDFVWKDLNDNGQQEGGEPGVNGVKVILWRAVGGVPSTKLDSTVTAGNGAYQFSGLKKDNYIVQIVLNTLPDSCLISLKPNVGSDLTDSDFTPAGLSPVVSLDPALGGINKDNPTIDAGLYSPKGTIGDFVWKDLNDNGQQDAGEPGVNGVKVILWRAVGGVPTTKLDSTLTAGNGAYKFTNVAKGTYIVQVAVNTLPDTCQISLKPNVGNDATDSDFSPTGLSPVVSIDPALGGINKDNNTIDAGLYSPCVKPVIGTLTPTAATCTGTITNSNAAFTVSGISGGNRYTFATTLAGLATYANATPLVGSSFSVTGLPNPGLPAGQTYYIRVYNGKNDCFLDATVLVPFRDCSNNCVKPTAGPDVTVCKPVTTVNLPDAAANEEWVAGVTNPGTAAINPVTGVVTGLTVNGIYTFILRDKSLGSNCSDTVFVFRGVLELPKQSTCFDTLTLPQVAGATYTKAAGNPASITASGFASGMSTPGTVYTFIITRGQCSDTVRVERLKCDKVYDLSLTKDISKKLAMLGDTLTYTIKVTNEGEATAHGIEVTDLLNAGVQYISSTASMGSYSPGSKKWSFDSITVGTTLTLNIKVRVVAQGVWFNTAEITKMTEKDKDSTPGNGVEGEDDIDRECFTVPFLICRGQGSGLQLSVPAQYTGVVWFRKVQNGTPVQVGTGNSYLANETQLGSYEYTFTSTSGTCPAEGCCPIIIAVQDCCPVEVCVPFVITKKKK